ncbi:uncharacterized protein LOC132636538 isoform X1 [Lycium barbarum]|uniref:uncharacterized protein LOC132636538 isoform X1 n=1 Tax=Lycium barbarum TaxID=112863 RepID=UPI00293EE97E|nr:uncharacterized protein LOC132636538 isoform X1 [Lycium barbarum]
MILGANLVHKSKKDRVHKSKKDPTVVCEKSNESNKHGVLSLIGNHEDQLVSLQYFKHLFWRLEFTSKDIGFEDFMQVDKISVLWQQVQVIIRLNAKGTDARFGDPPA